MCAGLVNSPSRYRRSSAAAHVRGQDDVLVQVAPLLKLALTLASVSREGHSGRGHQLLRAHEQTVPLGDEEFLATLEEN